MECNVSNIMYRLVPRAVRPNATSKRVWIVDMDCRFHSLNPIQDMEAERTVRDTDMTNIATKMLFG